MASKGSGKNSYKVQVREDLENGAFSGHLVAVLMSSLGMTSTKKATNSPSRHRGVCPFRSTQGSLLGTSAENRASPLQRIRTGSRKA